LLRTEKTTWLCEACRGNKSKATSVKTTTCTSSSLDASNSDYLSDDYNSDSEYDIEITKVTTGNVDKFSALAKLNNADYDIISDPAGWLTCDIIQVLIQKVNQSIEGLQRPTLGRVSNFDTVSGELIQILHTGRDHWVCISYIACLPGMVHLYDSLYHDAISQEIEEKANDLLGGSLLSLDFVPIQQQSIGSDCGVFLLLLLHVWLLLLITVM
jgi:hypothetical protein